MKWEFEATTLLRNRRPELPAGTHMIHVTRDIDREISLTVQMAGIHEALMREADRLELMFRHEQLAFVSSFTTFEIQSTLRIYPEDY